MTERKINVLAEDSTVTRMFLVHLLESDPQICVVGAVGDGQAALDFVKKNKRDVVRHGQLHPQALRHGVPFGPN